MIFRNNIFSNKTFFIPSETWRFSIFSRKRRAENSKCSKNFRPFYTFGCDIVSTFPFFIFVRVFGRMHFQIWRAFQNYKTRFCTRNLNLCVNCLSTYITSGIFSECLFEIFVKKNPYQSIEYNIQNAYMYVHIFSDIHNKFVLFYSKLDVGNVMIYASIFFHFILYLTSCFNTNKCYLVFTDEFSLFIERISALQVWCETQPIRHYSNFFTPLHKGHRVIQFSVITSKCQSGFCWFDVFARSNTSLTLVTFDSFTIRYISQLQRL